MDAYMVVSLLTGARTEELRALTWAHVDLDGEPTPTPPCRRPSGVALRPAGGDTKTRKSRRTLALPDRCVDALRHRAAPDQQRKRTGRALAGDRSRLRLGSRHRARRGQRPARLPRGRQGRRARREGLDTARATAQLRVAAFRQRGSRSSRSPTLVGHTGTAVTETVYRHQLRPVLLNGAVAMDRIFPSRSAGSTDG